MAGSSEPEASDSLKSFGAVTKAFRKRAGMTQEDLSPHVRYSAHFIASIEQGRRFPPADFVERAEEALDGFGVLKAAAVHLTRTRGLATWFRQWALLEERAVNLYTYECRVIPGLLQTAAYARAVFESSPPPLDDEQINRLLAERLARQDLLTQRPSTAYSFIIEEALLWRCVGGAAAMQEQIDHLLACSKLRNVELQVMSLRQPVHAGQDGPMQLLETEERHWLGYFEGQRGSLLISDATEVSIMAQRYAIMRSQALTPEDSRSLMERLRGQV